MMQIQIIFTCEINAGSGRSFAKSTFLCSSINPVWTLPFNNSGCAHNDIKNWTFVERPAIFRNNLIKTLNFLKKVIIYYTIIIFI